METTRLKPRCWFIILSVFIVGNVYSQCTTCPAGATVLTNKATAFTISSGQTYCASSNVTLDDFTIASGTLYIAQNVTVTCTGNLQLTGTGNIQACRRGGITTAGSATFSNTSSIFLDGGSFLTVSGALLVLSATASINMSNCSVMEVCGSFTLSQNNIFKKVGSGCNSRFITRASSNGTGTLTSTAGITWVDDANSTIPRGSATYCGQFAYFSGLACAPSGGSTCGTAKSLANSSYNAFALPISLSAFKAVPEYNRIKINWQTSSETNNDYFVLQKSTDGLEFENLTTIKSKAVGGNSSSLINYSFMDELTAVSYYRLKQTDFDGNESYSNIIFASNTRDTSSLIWPNPATNMVSVPLERINDFRQGVTICDMLGTLITLPVIASDDKRVRLNTENLSNGMYYIPLNGIDNIQEYHRLVIRR